MQTTAQVAQAAGVSVWSLYDALRGGYVNPPPKVGRQIIWGPADRELVVKFFDARRAKRVKA